MKDSYERIEAALVRTLKAFTEEHRDLTIESEVVGHILAVRIQAHASDTGRIIGDKGVMIKAIQKVFAQIGQVMVEAPVKIRVMEPEAGERKHYPPFQDDPQWPKAEIQELFEELVDIAFSYGGQIEIQDGKDFSMIHIEVADDDPQDTDLQEALSTIAKAIGKSKGRILHVEIKKTPWGNR